MSEIGGEFNTELPLVTEQQGLYLKNLGFDKKTEWAYQNGRLVHDSRFKELKNWNVATNVSSSAPYIQVALKWLRDRKGMNIAIYPKYNELGVNWVWQISWSKPKDPNKPKTIDLYDSSLKIGNDNDYIFTTYESAESAALSWILHKLLGLPQFYEKNLVD